MGTVRYRSAFAAAALSVLLAAPAASRPNPHAELECSYCHLDTPRFGVDTRATVNFWRGEGDEPQLCERCHGPEANFHPLGVAPGPEQLGTRLPEGLPLGESEAVRGQVVCTTCHFVHAASADHKLLRGFAGSDQPELFREWQDLCRACHVGGVQKRSPHAGDSRACAFCHAAKPQPGQAPLVTPSGRRLCEFCHGPKDEAHYAGVNPYDGAQECTGCHDPHAKAGRTARLKDGYFDKIRGEVTLNPHGKRTTCFVCHGDGKPGPPATEPVALCQRCHGSGKIPGMSHPQSKVPAGYAIPAGWPLTGGSLTCLTCHWPGHAPGAVPGRADEPAGTQHLLRGGAAAGNAVCFQCHSRAQWKDLNLHADIAQKKTGCKFCHAGDPDAGETDTFVADINILCLVCHDQPDHPANARHTVKLTAGKPAVPAGMPLGFASRITCATCHDPHTYPAVAMRLRGAKEPTAFCVRCHKL